MGAPSSRPRVKRLFRLFNDVREHTGSSLTAIRYVGGLILKKLPDVVTQLSSVMYHRRLIDQIRKRTPAGDESPPVLAIKAVGGLGDYLVIARFVRDLARQAGTFQFDIYTNRPEIASWVFRGITGFRDVRNDMLFSMALPAYTVAASINQFIIFEPASIDRAALRRYPRLLEVVDHAVRFRPRIEPFIQNHPYMDGYLAQKAVYASRSRADFLHHIAGVAYTGDRLDLDLEDATAGKFGLEPGRYITIHNGFDPNFFTLKPTATKCYPHFDAVVAWLKGEWPSLRFVQIGADTSDPLSQVDVNLIGRTSLKEAACLVQGAILHIDNESGLVHLARCLGAESCVVFGPTPANYFAYTGNINISPSFCGGCWWTNETWMDQCPRGFVTARCMSEQPPLAIAEAVHRRLTQLLPPDTSVEAQNWAPAAVAEHAH